MLGRNIRCALAAATGLLQLACSSVPQGRSAIDVVEIHGTHDLDAEDVADHIATAPSEKFLGLMRGVVYDYEVYDPTVLQRDLARVERYCRGKGYFEAHARAGRVEHVSANHVRVEIVVDEGPPTTNRTVKLVGLESLPPATGAKVTTAANDAIKPGARFDEAKYDDAKNTVKKALTDLGYAWATVDADARVDLGARAADYVLTVKPGPLATFGAITIGGLDPDGKGPEPQEIDEAPLRRAIAIKPGEPYSTAKLDTARTALFELGVFSAIDVTPSLPTPPPDPPVVPVKVTTQPTKLRQVHFGGGLEYDEYKTDVHLLAGWEDRNFLGGLRSLTIDFTPGVVPYPTRLFNFVAPNKLLFEEKLKVAFTQPSFLEPRTRGFIKPNLSVYPLLVDTQTIEDSTVIGYIEAGASVGVERSFGKLNVNLSYNAQVESPFAYLGDKDPDLPAILLSFPQLVTKLDYRDNAQQPHSGFFLSNTLQVAGGIFGGSAHDLKVQPAASVFIPLAKHVTLAMRASIGLMSAANYQIYQDLTEPQTDANRAQHERDIEIIYFRGFTSGGPNSNRGYPLRSIAPHGIVPFLNPGTLSTQLQYQCNPQSGQPLNPATCSIPIAGLSLWESSIETRFDVAAPFSFAVFCDAGDVSAKEMDIRLGYLHLSCGVGARYDTPVGPIRLDIADRVAPLQVVGYPNETAAARADNGLNGPAPSRLWGGNSALPIEIAFGIGEAF